MGWKITSSMVIPIPTTAPTMWRWFLVLKLGADVGRVACAVVSRVSGAGNVVRERRWKACFGHPASTIQKYTSLFEVYILSRISFAFSVFQYLSDGSKLYIILCLEGLFRISVQLHKYLRVLCAFRCEHQLFNRTRTSEVGKTISWAHISDSTSL